MSDPNPTIATLSVHDRREKLVVLPAPAKSREYISTLVGQLAAPIAGLSAVTAEVRFVPDRHITALDDFQAYLDILDGLGFESLEDLASAIRDDFANALLGKWTQVTLTAHLPGRKGDGDPAHGVVMEDRQPNWNNTQLLDRLKRY